MNIVFLVPALNHHKNGRINNAIFSVFEEYLDRTPHRVTWLEFAGLTRKANKLGKPKQKYVASHLKVELNKAKPDLVIIQGLSNAIMHPDFLHWLKRTYRCTVFYWSWDDSHDFRTYSELMKKGLKYIDVAFTCCWREALDFYYQHGVGRVEYLVDFYSRDFLYNCRPEMTKSDRDRFDADVSFCGNATYDKIESFEDGLLYKRTEFFLRLIEDMPDVKLKLWGRGWDEIPALKPYAMGWIHWHEVNKVYSCSRINLNFLYHHGADRYVNMRFIQIMACSAFQLCTYYPGIENVFQAFPDGQGLEAGDPAPPVEWRSAGTGQELAVFNSYADMLQKIAYYLTCRHEREMVAENGSRRVQADFDLRRAVPRIIALGEGMQALRK